MTSDDVLPRHGHRLIQAGVILFLVALFVGLAVPRFAVPRLALSAHLLGIMQGTFVVAAGLVWPRLRLSRGQSRAAGGLLVYGCVAAWTANLAGALFRAGNSMLPIAAGAAHGNAVQEGAIRVLLVSAALSLIVSTVMILWGLRTAD